MRSLLPLLVLILLAASVSAPHAQPTQRDGPALTLVGARLYLDGKRILGPFSVRQSPFGYLHFYVPGHGLHTVGAAPFEGAAQTGSFRGRQLTWTAGGAELRIESSTPILGPANREAWVRHEPGFELNVQGVIHGYGDHPSVGEQWVGRFGRP